MDSIFYFNEPQINVELASMDCFRIIHNSYNIIINLKNRQSNPY